MNTNQSNIMAFFAVSKINGSTMAYVFVSDHESVAAAKKYCASIYARGWAAHPHYTVKSVTTDPSKVAQEA
jgi:hypothetical protein